MWDAGCRVGVGSGISSWVGPLRREEEAAAAVLPRMEVPYAPAYGRFKARCGLHLRSDALRVCCVCGFCFVCICAKIGANGERESWRQTPPESGLALEKGAKFVFSPPNPLSWSRVARTRRRSMHMCVGWSG